MKKVLSAALVVASLAVGGVAAAAPATAVDYLQSGIRIRSTYSTSSGTVYGYGYPGQGATRINLPVSLYGSQYSYSNKRYGSGNSTVWVKNSNNSTGVTGFSGYYFIG